MPRALSDPPTPRFTIVSAVYNVAPYLDDFIDSLEKQTYGLDRVQIIMVDDGSLDESRDILERWRARRPGVVTVLSKPNGGQASARNLGLEHAQGEWITFTDPDDMLEPNAFEEVDRFLRESPASELVAMSRTVYHEKTGKYGRHPLHRHFAMPNVVRDLDLHPEFFFGSAPCAFFRREVIEREKLRFSELIKPNFEDGYFCNEYLLRVPRPLVGFVSSTQYVYRKRADESSTLNRSRLHPGRFTAVLEHGYLGLMRDALAQRGQIPEWIHNHVLYDLSYYYKDEEAEFSRQTVAVGEVADEFHRQMAQLTALLDRDIVRGFALRPYHPIAREILLHGYRDEPWHTDFVVLDKFDMAQQTVRLTYRFTHELPEEEFFYYGQPVEPLHAKVRAPSYFDRALVKERIVWLPVGTIRAKLNGQDVEVRTSEPDPPTFSLGTKNIRRGVDLVQITADARARWKAEKRKPMDLAISRLARTRLVRRLFAQAWVLMDRIDAADDSGEHLFRYLRAQDKSVNSWFVVERGTPAYRRLRKDGYRRVVPHGSVRWKLLMLNCTQLISSHADQAVTRPSEITRLAPPRWRFTFLQHGVIKDDLSNWLNPKDVDIFVTSTHGEYHSIVDDDTAYRYTTREVILSGLPRFDLVRAAGEKYPPKRRDLILIAPTWRTWLVNRVSKDTHEWAADTRQFRRSEFAENWRALLLDDRLRALAERSGLTIGVLMHPNLQSVASALDLPAEMATFDFESDVRELFARARVVVTDYSSMAFNAAYIERPVVYFQFDQERMFSGGHVGRGGYFQYERDGYGPVTLTPDDALAAVEEAVERGPEPAPEYRRRIEEAFPARDGRCCERVVAAIKELSRIAPHPDPFGPRTTADGAAAESAAADILDGEQALGEAITAEPEVTEARLDGVSAADPVGRVRDSDAPS